MRPEVRSAWVTFSRWERDYVVRRVVLSHAGRRGYLGMRPGKIAPGIVELTVSFLELTGRKKIRWPALQAAFPFQKEIRFAAPPTRCGHALFTPSTPREGTYSIQVTAWSPAGRAARPLRLRGAIR